MMTYVTGSASCGKSAEAERLCSLDGGRLVYLAAMRPFGEEGAQRVRKHRAQRAGKGFTTIECFDDFEAVLDDERIVGATALLECLGNVVANEMFGDAASRDGVADRIVDTIEELSRRCAHLVVVGNDVGISKVEVMQIIHLVTHYHDVVAIDITSYLQRYHLTQFIFTNGIYQT